MAWICSPSADNCIVKFYSVAEDVEYMFTQLIGFLGGISSGLYIMLTFFIIASLIIYFIYSVKKVSRVMEKNG